MRVVIYADSATEARDKMVAHIRQRVEILKNSTPRNKTTAREQANLAREMELEADWLSRIEFRPTSESADGVDLSIHLN